MADLAFNSSQWMTSKELAEFLGVTEPTVRAWKHRGQGPPWSKFVGAVRYDRAKVEAWAEKQRQEPPKKAS